LKDPLAFHHVAYSTKDLEATRHFYEDLFGFPLVNTEFHDREDGWIKHIFFDTGKGQCIAFFAFENIGERPDWATDVNETLGVPVFVNHAAFAATGEMQESIRARMASEDIEPTMEIDHGWCYSLYYLDPNQVLVELCRDTPGMPRDQEEAARVLAAPIGESA
jgi:catechol 2,3-dioxygenase-like lactoylglutathione lyase family enzyme